MSKIFTQSAPLEMLESLLPRLLSNLPIARAQIAVDQLRGAVDSQKLDQIVFLTASERTSSSPLAAIIAIQHSDRANSSSDMATVVHAGLLNPSVDPHPLQSAISAAFEAEMLSRHVRFVQWAVAASEHDTKSPASVANWCQNLGFEVLGTLDYQVTGNIDTFEPSADLHFKTAALEGEFFRELVEETYAGTQDCPRLNDFRTAAETLEGYRTTSSYAPELWFTVTDSYQQPVGTLILGKHQPIPDPESGELPQPIIEIVYMGLRPSARGKSYGRELVKYAFAIAKQLESERLILAVDQQNLPAAAIYASFHFQTIMSETVWARSIRT